MASRFRPWLKQWAISVDQLALVTLCFVTFVLLGRGSCPDADETISSRVGRNAAGGARWAVIAEWSIDRLFVALGDTPSHCRRSIERSFKKP
jgi:hypothetical protein